jgi:protein-tyrosine phosphatase
VFAVLLVCTGNICRTPMAEGFLRERSSLLPDGGLRVSSAGTWATHGNSPTGEAVIAAAERGADIRALQSTPVTPELVERADLVLTMTEEQRDEVLEQAPGVRGKTFTLKELVTLLRELGPPPVDAGREGLLARVEAADRLRRALDAPAVPDADVSDPLGLAVDAYRAVAWEIDGLVDALVEGLYGPVPRAPRQAEASEG